MIQTPKLPWWFLEFLPCVLVHVHTVCHTTQLAVGMLQREQALSCCQCVAACCVLPAVADPGMNFGEGTITNKAILDATGISDPLRFFKDMPAGSAGKLALAPHVYPATLTGQQLLQLLPTMHNQLN